MLFETTSQRNNMPSRGFWSTVRQSVTNTVNAPVGKNVAMNTTLPSGRKVSGVSAAQSEPSNSQSSTVTGWPTQQRKKLHHRRTLADTNSDILSYSAGRRQFTPAGSAPLHRQAQFGGKYMFTTAQPKGYFNVKPGHRERVQAPVYNTYMQQPVSYDSPYSFSAKPAPVSQFRTDVLNTNRPPTCRCGCCGSTGNGCTTLSNFAVGSAELTNTHLQQINELADTILKNKTRFVSITGHTDSKGTDENNIVLGMDRSVVVNRELRKVLNQRQPWSQTTIFWKTKTKGESQPVSEADAGRNMRVVVCLK